MTDLSNLKIGDKVVCEVVAPVDAQYAVAVRPGLHITRYHLGPDLMERVGIRIASIALAPRPIAPGDDCSLAGTPVKVLSVHGDYVWVWSEYDQEPRTVRVDDPGFARMGGGR